MGVCTSWWCLWYQVGLFQFSNSPILQFQELTSCFFDVVVLYCCGLMWFGGGVFPLASVAAVCAVARARKPEPILRGGFDVSGDAWVQLASSVCTIIVEASASDKLINHSNVRALHSAGVFDALCRLLAALMRKQRSTASTTSTSTTTGSSDHSDSEREYGSSSSGSSSSSSSGNNFPLLHTPYAKKLILALHALVSGQREHQRSFLQVTSRPRGHNEHTLLVYPLVRELNRAWVMSWLGATVPEMNPEDGSDMYLLYAQQCNDINAENIMDTWEAETKRVRKIASDSYELYACIQLLLAALQFEFDDGTEEVRRALARCSLHKTVQEVAMDVGGSAIYSLRVVKEEEAAVVVASGPNEEAKEGTTEGTTEEVGPGGPGGPGGGAKKDDTPSRTPFDATKATERAALSSSATPPSSSTSSIVAATVMLASGVLLPTCESAVARCARWYAIVMDECRELHLYHYDDETCVEGMCTVVTCGT